MIVLMRGPACLCATYPGIKVSRLLAKLGVQRRVQAAVLATHLE